MRALLLKVEKHQSSYGGHFFFAFFKGEDGKSYRSCLKPGMENWMRWQELILAVNHGADVWLDGLRVLRPGLIDADSWPKRIPKPEVSCDLPAAAP